MALDFVSPENVQECIRLTEEFRLLPENHRSREDKLEVHVILDCSYSTLPEILLWICKIFFSSSIENAKDYYCVILAIGVSRVVY